MVFKLAIVMELRLIFLVLIIGIQSCNYEKTTSTKSNLSLQDTSYNIFNESLNTSNRPKMDDYYHYDSTEEIVAQAIQNISYGTVSMLELELEKVLYRDQVYRDSIHLFGEYERVEGLFWKKAREYDKANQRIVLTMFEQIGWPDTRKMSEKASMSIWMTIIHSKNTDFNKKILPYLEIAFRRDSIITAQVYATTIDRVCHALGKKTLYGTGIYFNEQDYSKSYIDTIRIRRSSIGLN